MIMIARNFPFMRVRNLRSPMDWGEGEFMV